MTNESHQKMLVLASLFVASIGLSLSVISLHRMQVVSDIADTASRKTDIDQLLTDNGEKIDHYIDSRIDAYIDRQAQARIARKFDVYKLAAEKTRTGFSLYGNEEARFTLVEYSDLECPYCKRFHGTPKELVDSSSGLVNWQWKHLPLDIHNPVAAMEAQASECVANIAGNRAFWVFIQQVFDETKGGGQGAGDLTGIAREIGVDEAAFRECVTSGRFRDKVAADLSQARELGVNSTPTTFIVDNFTGRNILLRGVQSPEALVSTIQRLKKEADASSESQP